MRSTPSTTPSQQQAVQAPKPQLLRVGDKVTISRRRLATKGFQISCLSKGQRANVEVVRGQRVPVGVVVSYPNGGPVVAITDELDGYRVSCKRS